MVLRIRTYFIKLLHFFIRIKRPLTLGVRCILHDGADSIMLVRHTYIPGWHLPGGGVEVGETCENALVREIREECLIDIIEKPTLVGVYFNSGVSTRDHVVLYYSNNWGKIQKSLSNRLEIAESSMFNLKDLPTETDASSRQRLDEWRTSNDPAEIW